MTVETMEMRPRLSSSLRVVPGQVCVSMDTDPHKADSLWCQSECESSPIDLYRVPG